MRLKKCVVQRFGLHTSPFESWITTVTLISDFKFDTKKKDSAFSFILNYLQNPSVPGTGLEPARLSAHAPETCASTTSAIRAVSKYPP